MSPNKRPQPMATPSRRKRLALMAAALATLAISCSILAFAPRGGRAAALPAPRPDPLPAAPAQTGKREAARFVRFNLFDQGIYPREIHVAQGLLAIAIEDYSGGTTGLVVERETGNAPQQVGVVGRGDPPWRGKGEMRLAPGRYQVYMADRPDNRALLVVEP
jgi:hypothetical protein